MEIVVIGAGLSGLAFAAAMRRKAPGARVTVCERDAGPSSRPQGYAIGVKGETGLPALRELDLERRVLSGDTVRVTDFVFTDQRGRVLLELRPAPGDQRNLTVRVQRAQLKSALLEAVGDGAELRFGQRCTGLEADGDGVAAIFDDQSRVRADYLVACDGVASAVRAQMIGDQPRFLGLTSIYGDAPIQPAHPLLEGGYFIALGGHGTSFFCYTQPRKSVHFSFTVPAPRPGEMDGAGRRDLLDRVERGTAGWFDLVREVVAATEPESVGARLFRPGPDRPRPRGPGLAGGRRRAPDGPVPRSGRQLWPAARRAAGRLVRRPGADARRRRGACGPDRGRAGGSRPQGRARVAPARQAAPYHQRLLAGDARRRLPHGQRDAEAHAPPRVTEGGPLALAGPGGIRQDRGGGIRRGGGVDWDARGVEMG